MPDRPKIIDTDSASPSKRNPAPAVTAGDINADPTSGEAGHSGVTETPGTASAQRSTVRDDSSGETNPMEGIAAPPTGDPEPIPGVPALADPNAPLDGDVNPLTAKDAELRTDAGEAASKSERPVEMPGVDKADVAMRRDQRDTELRDRQRAEAAARERGTGPAARDTSTEDREAAGFASNRPDRRGPVDVAYDGPERRRTVDSTHGLAEGQPVAHRQGAQGSLTLNTHGNRIMAGSTLTASYRFENEDNVDPGPGTTDLVLEVDHPRGRRLIKAVRTGSRGLVEVTFPVEFEGPYRLRLIDGSRVLATAGFTV